MSDRSIRTDLKFLIFSEIYSRLDSPKAMRVAYAHLEAAIHCMAKQGLDSVTLASIAKEAGVTPPALRRYFKDVEDIEIVSLKYIRLLFQKMTVDAALKHESAEEMLSAYVRSCFRWVESTRTHATVWFSFLHSCSHRKAYRRLNSAAVDVGTDRIVAMIEKGQEQHQFRCLDKVQSARLIQLLLTGGVLSALSEDKPIDAFIRPIENQCMKIARGE